MPQVTVFEADDMRTALFIAIVVGSMALAYITTPASAVSPGPYGCFVSDGMVFWDGHAHPAVFDISPGGPGFSVHLGADCDAIPARSDYSDKRGFSPAHVPPTPAPEPTATPTPTPTPSPEPVEAYAVPAWPYIPYCFWNEEQTAMWCYW